MNERRKKQRNERTNERWMTATKARARRQTKRLTSSREFKIASPMKFSPTSFEKYVYARIRTKTEIDTHKLADTFSQCVDNYGDKCTQTKNEILLRRKLQQLNVTKNM